MNSFQFPYIAEEDLYKEIKWLQEAVVYQIFPDRFYNGNPAINLQGTGQWGKGKFIEEVFMVETYEDNREVTLFRRIRCEFNLSYTYI